MYSHQSESFPSKPICSYVFVSSSQLTTTDFQLPGNIQSVVVSRVTPLQDGDVFNATDVQEGDVFSVTKDHDGDVFNVVSVHDGEVFNVTKVLAISYHLISANLCRSLLVILLVVIDTNYIL